MGKLASSNLLPHGLENSLSCLTPSDKKDDLISYLPDDILICKILSLLPIKDAVRTSVLSKRWIHLWKFITKFYFDNNTFLHPQPYDLASFKKFLENICTSSIYNFTLFSRDNSVYDPLISSLISFVTKRRVQRVYITYPSLNSPFPSTLFECKTLTELDINKYGPKSPEVKIPMPLHHPTLRKLCLCKFTFENSSSSSSPTNALLDFPRVKVFEIRCVRCVNVKNLRINTPRAERFVITQSPQKIDDHYNHTIEVFAPCVSRLTLMLFTSPPIVFLPPFPPSILQGCLAFHIRDYTSFYNNPNDHKYSLAMNLVQILYQVKDLLLFLDTMMIFQGSNFAKRLPTFANLFRLEIDSYITNFETLLLILHNSPVLKSLICTKLYVKMDENDIWVDNPPSCFASHLKSVTLGVLFFQKWLDAAKYMVENARALEEMTISVAVPDNSEFELKEDLILKSLRGSSHVEIEILKENMRNVHNQVPREFWI